MFCVGLRNTQGRDLDSQDVGAPLFFDGVTMGVVSFGVSDGDDSYPVVSTAIASYSNWIVETARYWGFLTVKIIEEINGDLNWFKIKFKVLLYTDLIKKLLYKTN